MRGVRGEGGRVRLVDGYTPSSKQHFNKSNKTEAFPSYFQAIKFLYPLQSQYIFFSCISFLKDKKKEAPLPDNQQKVGPFRYLTLAIFYLLLFVSLLT